MKPIKRTFEAKQHPKGSAERARLNLSWITSEYLPSIRYGIVEDNGEATCWNYPTKKQCLDKIDELEQRRGAKPQTV